MSTAVIFESDYALVADTRIPIRDVGAHGEMQIGGAFGPILRPLSYGERTRVVQRAAGSRHTIDNVCSAVLRAALVQAGECERLIAEILALALAGAERDAPSFAETALAVARAAVWSIRQINEAEADEIDRLAMALGGTAAPRADDGWHRIVFADDAAATSLAGVRHDLSERLLTRAEISPASQPAVAEDEADVALPNTPFEAPSRSGLPSDDETIPSRVASLYSDEPGAVADTQGDGDSPGMSLQLRDAGGSVHAASGDVGADASPAPRHYGEGQGMQVEGSSMQEPPLPITRTSTPQAPDTHGQSLRARAYARPHAIAGASPYSTADDLPGHSRRVTGTLERHPVNRVSYHPGGVTARVIHGEASTAVQGVGMRGESRPSDLTPPLSELHAASMAPRTVPEALTLAPSTGGQRSDAHVSFVPGVLNAKQDAAQVTERVSTLAQIEQLVGDEVADALAALLHHEADLRGIEP